MAKVTGVLQERRRWKNEERWTTSGRQYQEIIAIPCLGRSSGKDSLHRVEQNGDPSMMAMDMKKSFAHHLVGTAVKGGHTLVGTLKEQPLI